MVINLSPATIGVMCLVPGGDFVQRVGVLPDLRGYEVVCARLFRAGVRQLEPGEFNPHTFYD